MTGDSVKSLKTSEYDISETDVIDPISCTPRHREPTGVGGLRAAVERLTRDGATPGSASRIARSNNRGVNSMSEGCGFSCTEQHLDVNFVGGNISTRGTSAASSPNITVKKADLAAAEDERSRATSSNNEELCLHENEYQTLQVGKGKNCLGYRWRIDSLVPLAHPLPRPMRRLLEITELPFLILWVYFTYWVIIVALYAADVRNNVWVSAAIAGILVGIGLNANAYRMIVRNGQVDYGVIIRFFMIPFGVSSLSGITNSLRDRFLLVFPKDAGELVISICVPALVILVLACVRLVVLAKIRVKLNFRVLLLNGILTDRPADINKNHACLRLIGHRGAKRPTNGAETHSGADVASSHKNSGTNKHNFPSRSPRNKDIKLQCASSDNLCSTQTV